MRLCVLAAGLGRRFGGTKPLAPVTDDGATLMDLTIADAARSGFAAVVAVVRTELEAAVRDHLRTRSSLPVTLVRQDACGPRRPVPWGTAHALVAAAPALEGGPFAVANADDRYGSDAMACIGAWLAGDRCRADRAALVTYRLDATLPPSGAVSRAPCTIRDGSLVAIAERTGVRWEGVAGGPITSDPGPLPGDTPVSMNLWGFHPSVLARLAAAFERFAPDHLDDEAELRLPDLVGELVSAGALEVDALPTTSRWTGITHPDDVATARAALDAEEEEEERWTSPR